MTTTSTTVARVDQDRSVPVAAILTRGAAATQRSRAAANPLERMAGLILIHDRLTVELGRSRSLLDAARAYRDSAGSHPTFARLQLDRCRARHSAILAQLRENRIEALALLDPEQH